MDYQLFPTGVRTAAKMWAKFKRPVTHVCDPSAGKGLCAYSCRVER